MDNNSLVISSKKWYRITNYIVAVGGLFLFTYIINKALFKESGDPIFFLYFLSAISALGIVASLFILFTQHRYQIIISEDRIVKQGSFNKEILFNEVQKIVVRNGGIEVKGKNFFETITFGDLHQNNEEARDFLSQKISSEFEVEIKGRDKYVKQFLASSS